MSTTTCRRCGATLWMVEYDLLHQCHHDGVSEYRFKNFGIGRCTYKIGRWCEKKLGEYEAEPRYCTDERHVVVGEVDHAKADEAA